MKKILFLLATAGSILLYGACEKSETGSGTLNLSITDAPIDSAGVTGVYIAINRIEYHSAAEGWVDLDTFATPLSFNLLELTRGTAELLGSYELPTGTYSQIRFHLDQPNQNQGVVANPGCYLEWADGSTQPLFVPSGAQSGYKAVGAFHIPVNGTVDLTADFDVRKSVVVAGNSGKLILKPTIRLVANNQAGSISGTVSGYDTDASPVVYAYQAGTFTEEEAADPAEEQARFPNAISSDVADDEGYYHLAYLAPGSYDLVVVSANENGVSVLSIEEQLGVESRQNTNYDIVLGVEVEVEIEAGTVTEE